MTYYYRSGHWRTTSLGNTHWVSGHDVSRDDWAREVFSSPAERLTLLRMVGYSSCWVNPNAECPVCGQQVFYYQNERGSRVFFDDLGPPWPRHPCIDGPRTLGGRRRTLIIPEARSDEEAQEIGSLLKQVQRRPRREFIERHGQSPWEVFVLRGMFAAKKKVLLVMDKLGARMAATRRFASIDKAPAGLADGHLLFAQGGRLHFLNPRTQKPVELATAYLRGARQFVDALIED